MATDVLKIGQTIETMETVPTPTNMKIQVSALDASDTSRPADGYIVRVVVRGNEKRVRKYTLEWASLTEAETSRILQLMTDPFFYMYYRDPRDAEYRIGQFYAGNQEIEVRRIKANGELVVKSLSVAVTER